MGLFSRFFGADSAPKSNNRYDDSILHIADSISNDGDASLLLWRADYSDFNTGSVLTVNPGEAAVFINNGQVQKEFGPGRYQLESQNYPFLSALRNTLTGGVTTFHCEIYYVRTATSLEIKWGTSSPIQLRDPVQRLQTSISGYGAYKVLVKNPSLFIMKLAGHVQSFRAEELSQYFASEFQQTLKSGIASAIRDSGREILEMSADLETLSSGVASNISTVLDGYGLGLQNFAIAALTIPEDDPNRQKLENAYASKREVEELGENYRLVKGLEIMKDMANNPGGEGAGMASMGAGLSMGMVAGSAMSEIAKGVFAGSSTNTNTPISNIENSTNINAQSVSGASSTANASSKDAPSDEDEGMAKLRKLKKLLDEGLIEPEDYNVAKKEVLAKLV